MCSPKPKPPKITSKAQAISALKLFCDRIERIKDYSFFKVPLAVKRRYDFAAKVSESQTDGPTDEQIDAVLLHLRLFTVGNEDFSVRFTSECLDHIQPSQVLKNEVAQILEIRNHWQSHPSRVGSLTKSQLFGALAYGGRVHSNDKTHVSLYTEMTAYEMIEDVENVLIAELIWQHFMIMKKLSIAFPKILNELDT